MNSKLEKVKYPRNSTFDIAPYVFGARVEYYDLPVSKRAQKKARRHNNNGTHLGEGYYNFYQNDEDAEDWVN